MRKALWRLGAALAAAAVAISGFGWAAPAATAEDTQTNTQISYIAPELSSDAPAYDETHPEDLVESQLYAKSAILIEADSGEVIFEKNADERMYPASTTKILTVLLGLTMGDLDATVTMDTVAADLPDDNISTIPLSVEIGRAHV